MVVITFLAIGLLLVILQTTLFMPTPVWPAAPDLYYILVAYLAYRMDLLRSLVILFPLSCVLDVLSGTVLGMYPAICFGGFFLLRFMADRLPVRESLYQVPMIAVSYLVVNWLVYVVLFFLEPVVLIPWSWPLVLLRAALIIVFSFPLFRVFERINRRLQGGFSPLKRLRVRSGNRFR